MNDTVYHNNLKIKQFDNLRIGRCKNLKMNSIDCKIKEQRFTTLDLEYYNPNISD